MFLIIPLTIFILAAGALTVLVWRKLPHLKELTPVVVESRKPFAQEMFPEVYSRIANVDVRGFWRDVLRETEKLLRWLRVFLGHIVRASDRLIHRVRQEHLQHDKSLDEVVHETHQKAGEALQSDAIPAENPVLALQQQEKTLIEAIAANPRDAQLYREIGDVYAKLKSYNDAKAAFEAVLKLNPADTAAQAKLSSVLQKLPEDGGEKK